MEKYGFVYIWYDRKHKRYYIGCHWGTTDDGYICSSRWMKNSYKRRPKDFKRRILVSNISDKQSMFEEEYRYLSMIKPSELNTRYYNNQIKTGIHWSCNKYDETITKLKNRHWVNRNDSDEIRKKISDKRKGLIPSDETKRRISETKKGMVGNFSGKKHSDETKRRISETKKGTLSGEQSPHYKKEKFVFVKNGTIFEGTRHEFQKCYGVPSTKISAIISGKRKSAYGWSVG